MKKDKPTSTKEPTQIHIPKFILVIIPIILGAIYFYMADENLKKQLLYSYNVAFFGGDVWEYQSMAVNFLEGYGVNVSGQTETVPFEGYKFAPMGDTSTFKEAEVSAYRTPGHPLFLGAVYND